jgi:ParB family chromosome partitioning protein
MSVLHEGQKIKPLGRGLASLLGLEEDEEKISEGLLTVSLDVLIPGKYQPRQEFNPSAMESLVASIKEKGVLQPVLVRPTQHPQATYEIIAGERRWQAARVAGLSSVPVLVRPMSDQHALEAALIENIQRDDLTPLEEAEGYQRLMDEFNHTQEALAHALGKSRSHLANMMRLLSLPPKIKVYIQQGKLSAGHARTLVGHPQAELLAEKIVKGGLNVRQAEKLAQAQKKPQRRDERPRAPYDEDCALLERTIEEATGLKAQLILGPHEYKLNLLFDNMEDLDKIVQRLCAHT